MSKEQQLLTTNAAAQQALQLLTKHPAVKVTDDHYDQAAALIFKKFRSEGKNLTGICVVSIVEAMKRAPYQPRSKG